MKSVLHYGPYDVGRIFSYTILYVFVSQPAQPHTGHFVRTKFNTPVVLEPIPYEFIA